MGARNSNLKFSKADDSYSLFDIKSYGALAERLVLNILSKEQYLRPTWEVSCRKPFWKTSSMLNNR